MTAATKVWVLVGVVAVLAIGVIWGLIHLRDEPGRKPAAVASAIWKIMRHRDGQEQPGSVVADNAVHRADTLQNTVANLDNYRVVTETSVQFGFDKDNLTEKAEESLDKLAARVPKGESYILTVSGGTDTVGSQAYNYGLSERRADAVIQYLGSKYKIPAHKIYVIGLGKDTPIADDNTQAGRTKNRRVDIRLMTNAAEVATPAQSNSTAPPTR